MVDIEQVEVKFFLKINGIQGQTRFSYTGDTVLDAMEELIMGSKILRADNRTIYRARVTNGRNKPQYQIPVYNNGRIIDWAPASYSKLGPE